MDNPDSYQLWQKEKELIEELRVVRPELLVPPNKTSESILMATGVKKSHNILGGAVLKATFADFIVEEIQLDGSVVKVDSPDETSVDAGSKTENEHTIYATLVKIGISTLEAVNRIADALHIEKTKVGYAGIKDAVAITAQRISVRGGVSLDQLRSLKIPQIILKDITRGKGVINFGALKGNRFSIVLRLSEHLDQDTLTNRLEEIKQNGLLNYYGPQRFGSPRFQSHYLGQLVLTQQYEKLVRAILVRGTDFEWPVVVQLRAKAAEVYGNWKVMKDIFSVLPYTLRQELAILDILISADQRAINWLKILSPILDQLDFWAKSYASLIANELLSDSKETGKQLPDVIPLLLNMKDVDEVNHLYWQYLERDGTTDFRSVLDRSSFIRRGENSYLQTKIFPQNVICKIIPGAVVVGFDLPKGAYATTLLYELFDIDEQDTPNSTEQLSFIDSHKVLDREGGMDVLSDFLSQYGKK